MTDIIEVKAGIEAENDRVAAEVRDLLRKHHVRLINLMASPGAGKTTLLEQTVDGLKLQYRIAVLEDGAIAACGTHEELMETSAVYRDICESQLGKGGAA